MPNSLFFNVLYVSNTVVVLTINFIIIWMACLSINVNVTGVSYLTSILPPPPPPPCRSTYREMSLCIVNRHQARDGIRGHQFDRILESFAPCYSYSLLLVDFTEKQILSTLFLKIPTKKSAKPENSSNSAFCRT